MIWRIWTTRGINNKGGVFANRFPGFLWERTPPPDHPYRATVKLWGDDPWS